MSWPVITPDRVRDLHAEGLRRWGGGSGAGIVETVGCVDRSIGAAVNAALYVSDDDSEPDPLNVASHLLFYLAKNHCFEEGNKRAAWLAATDQLALLGLDLVHVEDSESEKLVQDVVGNQSTPDDVHVWLAERLTAAPW